MPHCSGRRRRRSGVERRESGAFPALRPVPRRRGRCGREGRPRRRGGRVRIRRGGGAGAGRGRNRTPSPRGGPRFRLGGSGAASLWRWPCRATLAQAPSRRSGGL